MSGGIILKRILLINDSIFENVIMRDILEEIGYQVEISNEFEAFGAMDQFKPEVIISNLIMKRITGDILLKKMKQENPQLKTILSSSSIVKVQELSKNDIDYFIQIPSTKNDIEKVLMKLEEEAKRRFCPDCGGNIESLNTNSKFCPYCGNKL